jgi:hypothetical protein
VGEIASGERVEGYDGPVVVVVEFVERGLSVGACAVDGSRASTARCRDCDLPHIRSYLLNGTGTSERAMPTWRGVRWSRSSSDGEVLDTYATRLVDTAGHVDAVGERTVREFPRESPRGGESAVDANLGGAVGSEVPAPEVVVAGAVDVGFEAFVDRRHSQSRSGVYVKAR